MSTWERDKVWLKGYRWKRNLYDKLKWEFFQVVAVFVLLYGYTIWTLMYQLDGKARWELHKNATKCFERIWKAAPP